MDSHRETPVSPFGHACGAGVIHIQRAHGVIIVVRGFIGCVPGLKIAVHGSIIAVHDFGRFWDILVTVTQSAQLIQNSCSSLFVDGSSFQNLNP